MKVRPITFTAAEVLAIRDGRKTQFRKVIKLRDGSNPDEGDIDLDRHGAVEIMDFSRSYPYWESLTCPYGQPGDRLLVRGSYPKSIRITELLLLEIESVRVERLQEISEQDAKEEGADPTDFTGYEHPDYPTLSAGAYRNGFIERCGDDFWSANPWVWVVEFRVVEGGHE